MTMRRPAAFMAARSSTDKGRDSAVMGTQFCQLSTPEVAMGQPGMGNDKVPLVHVLLTEPHDVEVECPCPPTLGAGAPFLLFDGLACFQEGTRLEPGVKEDHLIEIGRLMHAAQRGGLLDRGRSHQLGVGKCAQCLTRSLKMEGAVSQVAAQCNVGALARARPVSLRPQSGSRCAEERRRAPPAPGWHVRDRPGPRRLRRPVSPGYRC